MICPNCGMELDESENVCSLCGYEFTEQTDEEIISEFAVSEPAVSEVQNNKKTVSSGSNEKSGQKKFLVIILVLLAAILILLGVAAAFLLTDKEQNNSARVAKTSVTTEATTVITTETTVATTTSTTTSATTEKVTTTKATTKKPESAEVKIAYVDINDGYLNVRKKPNTDAEKLGKLSDGDEVRILKSVDNEWYEIEYNGSVGYVSSKYVSENPHQNHETVRLDENGLLNVNIEIFGRSHESVCKFLDADLPQPVAFPWWGVNLKNVDYTYNGVPLCFMFQNDQLVMIIYDIESEFRNDICDAAYEKFGDPLYPHVWDFGIMQFEITMDNYATDGTSHFKQQYTFSDMIW